MAGETRITIIGNLTADPELRFTQNGLAVANLTIASTPREFDRATNQYKDGEALFLRASIWREAAEQVAATLVKGTRVIAVGNLKQRSYETKEGEKRTSYELEIDEIGPSLKWATAQVTRTQSQNSQGSQQYGHQGGAQQGVQGFNAPQPQQWAQPQQQGFGAAPQQQGGQGFPQQGAPQRQAQPQGGDQVWNTPGSYSDETPF